MAMFSQGGILVINGSTSWDGNVVENLGESYLDGQIVDFFIGSPKSLYDCARKSAENNPDKIFLIDETDARYTFLQTFSDATRYAYFLKKTFGIQKGDRIGLLLDTSYTSLAMILAINALGAISVMLPTKYKINEIALLVEKTTPKLIIHGDRFSQLSDLKILDLKLFKISSDLTDPTDGTYGENPSCFETNLEDPAIIIFTSGTTSQAKGVILKNYNVIHAIVSYARVLGFSGKDSSILCTPMYYVTGLIAIFGLLLFLGGTIYIHSKFNAVRVLETVRRREITFLHGSPTVFYLLLNEQGSFPALPSLKKIICGSSNLPKDRITDIHRWLPKVDIRTVYGLTETSSPGTIMPHNTATSSLIGSSGKPIPGFSVKIVDNAGNTLEQNQHGEILVKGTNVFNHYYGVDDSPLINGWFPTGDIGYINSLNYLFIVDRKKNMINRGGEKIWSYDVENELCTIPGIIDAAVVAIPNEKYGEVPVAAVVQSPENKWTESEIIHHLKTRLANFQIPERILFLQEIPQTANFKQDKKKIVNLFLSREKEE